jgi:RND family efflux transporter MFP subunit
MKNWKSIVGIVVALAIIVSILVINKRKLAASTSGGVNAALYVSVEKVVKKNLSATLTLTGTVNAYNDLNIMSETSGKVTGVYVNVGDYKKSGSVLFQVDDELKQAAYMSAAANYEKAKKDLGRYEDLYNQKSASDAQYDLAKLNASVAEAQYITAKRQLEDTKIKTPISGVVTLRNVDLGAMVQAAPSATLVANIVDITKLKVKLNVSEGDAYLLKTGDPVNVTTDIIPGVVFNGKITSISAKGDEAHTYPVEIVVDNRNDHQLRAGMFVRVEFKTMKDRDVLVISRESLVGSVKDPKVYIVDNGIVHLRTIAVGSESGTMIQVLNGLAAGETVVTNGQNNLVENAKVEILNK